MRKISFQHLYWLWRYLGPRWLAYRLGYELRIRTGMLQRQLPCRVWDDQPLGYFLRDAKLAQPQAYLDYRRRQAPPFFFSPEDCAKFRSYFNRWDQEATSPVLMADQLGRGILRYFDHTQVKVGFPPNWHVNPFTGQRTPSDSHWTQILDFGSGDIKVIWEASRFGFTYALVRAYWRTGDERYPEWFWQLVEDWKESNQPQSGANWKCGQEISIRLMAWLFGLYGFLFARGTTPDRVAALSQMVAVSSERIEKNISYALSQRNNHGISEAVGLWTVGLLFPELRSAAKWREKGRTVLERLAVDLIYDDGSFFQHSFNYHRLMLHAYTWAVRLGEMNGVFFSNRLKEKIRHSCQFLYQVQDEMSGKVPNYGSNDGALILPLNNCDSTDFRPVIQTTYYLMNGTRCYAEGPWDEDLLWVFGPVAISSPVKALKRSDMDAKLGGYYTLRGINGFAFLRCSTFRNRPGQADMLHADLWWKGLNLALDPGTYSYNAAIPWNNEFARSFYHNTVTVDGFDQMERFGKFLWLPWLSSHIHSCLRSKSGHLAYLEGEHDGYKKWKQPVSHTRGILYLKQDTWLVLDNLSSNGNHFYRLHWLFSDFPYTWDSAIGHLLLQANAGQYNVWTVTKSYRPICSLVRCDPNTPRGWWSPYYHYREPALSIALEVQAKNELFLSLFSPESCRIDINNNSLCILGPQWHAIIELNMDRHQPLIHSVVLSGDVEDRLTL